MADNHRSRGGRGHQNFRKRRYRDDDDQDRYAQRRRYEEPIAVKLRRQLRSIAESPVKQVQDEVAHIAQTIADNYFDEELQNEVCDLLLQLVLEQPFKIPFIAAIVLVTNTHKSEVTQAVLARTAAVAQEHISAGAWREFKLVLRFLGLLQGLFDDEGIFPLLEDLFSRAVDLQTASSEDALGLELAKIILLTLPYVLASSATGMENLALALLDKTDIIASTPHALEALVDPYPGEPEDKPRESPSMISLLQKQLQAESTKSWPLACIPRPWKTNATEDDLDSLAAAIKHPFPGIVVPDPIAQTIKPMFPELFFSVYADQDVETVPSTRDVASSLLRDAAVDTINILNFNRHAVAKFLADIDCYFSPGTFVKRATPFDKLKDLAGQGSTWKPEDVAVDAVFSQIFQLPAPEHKLVYYHSVLTESCKVAPAAVAPSLGRAIRFGYRTIAHMDLELSFRFMDWFSHHLSNFGFTWKWTEWVDDVALPDIHPKKAFIIGALDKEIRLSFAQRIKGTLPEPYQALISATREQDTPDLKFDVEGTPFKDEAQEMVRAIRKRESDEVLQSRLNDIRELADKQGSWTEPLNASTDVLMTSICAVGSKSLSHVLSCIERCKGRLLDLGQRSEATRKQMIDSVLDYWHDQPGIGVNIIDKLLNYTILTPTSVIEWVLLEHNQGGATLAQSYRYEMVSMTVAKVTGRVRQIVAARLQADLPPDLLQTLDDTLEKERTEQTKLFAIIEDALVSFVAGNKDEMLEAGGDGTSVEQSTIREWGARWLRVFRRKAALEEAYVLGELANISGKGEAGDGDRGHQGVNDDAQEADGTVDNTGELAAEV